MYIWAETFSLYYLKKPASSLKHIKVLVEQEINRQNHGTADFVA